MIGADQPDIFPSDVLVCVSSRQDGTMLDRTGLTPPADIDANRQAFCQANGVDYRDVVQQNIVYNEDQTYDRIVTVTSQHTVRHTTDIAADALFTNEQGVGLFLPVADCVATVVYDPLVRCLALVHLGRHSTLTNLVAMTVMTFMSAGSKPSDLLVWMSPSAQRSTYRLDHFELADDPSWQGFCDRTTDGVCIDMAGYNREQFIRAGVAGNNIHMSPINTMTSPDYFSHAAGDADGRMAVLAVMR